MVHYHCIAIDCNNDSRKKGKTDKYPDMLDINNNTVNFFPLPSARKHRKQRRAWISALRRADFNPGPNEYWHSVCSRHFIDHMPTKENPIPTLFSYNNYKKGEQRQTKNSQNKMHKSKELNNSSDNYNQDPKPVVGLQLPMKEMYKGVQCEVIVIPDNGKKCPREVPVPADECIQSPSIDHTYSLTSTKNDSNENGEMEEPDVKALCTSLTRENQKLKVTCSSLEKETTLLREQVRNMEIELKETRDQASELNNKLKEKDKLFRELLLEKLTKSDQNARIFLGLPSITFLMGLFEILKDHASKMKYWTRKSSSEDKNWQQGNKRKPGKSRKLTLFEEFVLTLIAPSIRIEYIFPWHAVWNIPVTGVIFIYFMDFSPGASIVASFEMAFKGKGSEAYATLV